MFGILLRVALLAVFCVTLVRTAWICDDAYISFRVVENFVDGYGLRWNTVERVQVFTHPLWLLLVSGVRLLTGEVYFSTLGISLALSIGAASLVGFGIGKDDLAAAAALVILTFSKSFVDFSTSGLESPMTHVLLAVFLALHVRGPNLRASIVPAGLLLVTRLDLALLVVPVLAGRASRTTVRLSPWAFLALAGPIAAWTTFSMLYYGSIWPNTAYAKLGTGIPRDVLLRQGLVFLADSFDRDPITLLAIVAGVLASLLARELRAFAVGVVLYLGYVVWIGGDFMSGRFLSAPLLVSAGLGAHTLRRWPRGLRVGAIVAACAVGFIPPRPTILSGPRYQVSGWRSNGIADERGVYYRHTGLLRWNRGFDTPRYELPERVQRALRDGQRVVLGDAIGMLGYEVRRRLHIIDLLGLADPLLSRLPSKPFSRVGHYYRELPEGYFETLESGQNRIVDPALARFYEELVWITREPLFHPRRLSAIFRLNIGAHDGLRDTYLERLQE